MFISKGSPKLWKNSSIEDYRRLKMLLFQRIAILQVASASDAVLRAFAGGSFFGAGFLRREILAASKRIRRTTEHRLSARSPLLGRGSKIRLKIEWYIYSRPATFFRENPKTAANRNGSDVVCESSSNSEKIIQEISEKQWLDLQNCACILVFAYVMSIVRWDLTNHWGRY